MPTWVVPSIAAEMWRVSLNDLLGQIASGSIPAKLEEGFTFVDVDPYGSAPRARATKATRAERPATYRGLTDQELRALHTETPLAVTPLAEPPVPSDETPAAWQQMDWRAARRIVQRKRIPPK
jgi:hypothetical protein